MLKGTIMFFGLVILFVGFIGLHNYIGGTVQGSGFLVWAIVVGIALLLMLLGSIPKETKPGDDWEF